MKIRATFILLFALLLGGCLYKMDIHQGNVIDQEQIDELQTGMSKLQVIDILGTPQLVDPFHTERWDYYSMSNVNNRKTKTERLLTLKFDGDSLVEIVRPAPLPEPAEKESKLFF